MEDAWFIHKASCTALLISQDLKKKFKRGIRIESQSSREKKTLNYYSIIVPKNKDPVNLTTHKISIRKNQNQTASVDDLSHVQEVEYHVSFKMVTLKNYDVAGLLRYSVIVSYIMWLFHGWMLNLIRPRQKPYKSLLCARPVLCWVDFTFFFLCWQTTTVGPDGPDPSRGLLLSELNIPTHPPFVRRDFDLKTAKDIETQINLRIHLL